MTKTDNNHDVEHLLRSSAEAEVPHEVQARLRRRLVDFRDRMEQAETPQEESIIMIITRKAISGRIRWAAAAAIAILVIALVIGLNPWNDGSGRAYAAAVEQLRLARTMTYTYGSTSSTPGRPSVTSDHAFKEPGHSRLTKTRGKRVTVVVSDLVKKRMITLMPATKQYQEIDLSGVTSDEYQGDEIEKLRTLPDRADEELGQSEIDGRQAHGFRVIEWVMDLTIWVDVETGDVVRIEGENVNAPSIKWTMTDFQFDVPLDDSLFSLSPPEGYTPLKPIVKASVPTARTEEDFVTCLRWMAEHHKDRVFPPTFDPAGMRTFLEKAEKEGKAVKSPMVGMSKEDIAKRAREAAQQAQKLLMPGMMFAMTMKSENDFHYQGSNGKLGEADKPICWWRPDGSETYRVVHADLSVRDVSPEDLPSH